MNYSFEGTFYKKDIIDNKDDLIKFFELSCNSNYIYRGQENSNWNLTSSFTRLNLNRSKLELPLADEFTMIKNFMDELSRYKKKISLWETISTMQHYGVKTRFLDFTKSFWVAVFFSLTENSFDSEDKKFKGNIYVIEKNMFKEPDNIPLKDFEIFSEECIGNVLYYYEPIISDERITNQEGCFIFSKYHEEDLTRLISIENNWHVIKKEKAFYNPIEQYENSTGLRVVELLLTTTEYLKLKKYLDEIGITSEFLFPITGKKYENLGFVESLNRRYA